MSGTLDCIHKERCVKEYKELEGIIERQDESGAMSFPNSVSAIQNCEKSIALILSGNCERLTHCHKTLR